MDLFPVEYSQCVQEVKNMNSALHNDSGMSKEKLNMAKFKVPIIIYRALDEVQDGFWMDDKGIKWYETTMKSLRYGNVRT
jgi:hypothetical protein